MRIQSNNGLLLLALGCICSLVNTAGAAENGEVVELDEVVVTATRTSATLSDAPAAVTVVNAKSIETKNASRLGDVLDQVPSLYMRGGALGQSQGTIGTSGMSLRGIDQTRTLILLDGQPIQDAGSGKVNWRVPFVEDIARIEVVPGAFSSLYGSNAIGGVVNIITKQPDQREFTAKIKKGWSDASGEDASIYFRDKMDNGLGIVAGFGYQSRDSYINDFVVVNRPTVAAGTVVTGAQAATLTPGTTAYIVGDKGAAPWRQINATTKISYDLPDMGKLFGGITYSETDLGYTMFNTYLRNAITDAPVFNNPIIGGQKFSLRESNFVNNSPLYESTVRYFAGFEGTVGSGYLLKIDLAQIERQYRFVNTNTTSTWGAGAGTQTNAPNSGTDGTVQLSFPVGGRHFIVSGVSLHDEKVDGITYALSNWRDPATRTGTTDGYSGDSTTASLFAQDEISMADKLKVYIGGRLDHWQTKGSYYESTTPSAITYASRSDSSFNSKLSAVYQVADAVTLRASYGQSFRAPTNNDLYGYANLFGITSIGDPNLKPEHGETWEIGGGWRVSDKLKANASYYQTTLKDLITNFRLSNFPIVSKRINAGKAKINGVELAAEAELTNWLTLNASYAYISSEMLENNIDALSVGKRLIDSPKNIINMGITAQQGLWTGMLNATYSSKVFSTAQNTDTAEGVPGSYDAHTMVNAKLGYAFSKMVKGTLAVNNMLDKKVYSYFLLPGRNVTAELVFSL
ncbi:TonB-dependent receptor [Polaromonas sp.]|uniref:TonB-dependent receptor n=1 Tax=Polaromonas sp. TaxID=1869339 RepID=UPI0027302107|nr:TonB-dependent receptor [Polaromonas sp.]MDP1742453.1 TonB-dependent receptor [Polaromonas sp.]